MKLNCVLVEGDPVARKVLEGYVAQLPDIAFVAVFGDMQAAYPYLDQHAVDVLYAAVPLAEARGKVYGTENLPALVLLSKDAEMASIAFEADAVDFLVKPCSLERFRHSVYKVQRWLSGAAGKPMPVAEKKLPYFFVKSDLNFVRVDIDKICLVEGVENYVRIYCEDKTIMVLCTMKHIGTMLNLHRFLRIHRSYIVNMDKVEQVMQHQFYIGDKVVPVGKSYRKPVAETLKEQFLLH